uniref:Uncharacterized protein n=1 Tax=Anopheles melas TaxID=34690 RepID=A0A182TTJ5_9DIPT
MCSNFHQLSPEQSCPGIFRKIVTLATPGDTVPPVLWRSRRKAGKLEHGYKDNVQNVVFKSDLPAAGVPTGIRHTFHPTVEFEPPDGSDVRFVCYSLRASDSECLVV